MNLTARILARTAVVALVAVSTAFFASCSKKDDGAAKKEEAAKELQAAKDAFKEKKFEDAAKSLQSASDKDDSEATLLLAICYGAGKGVEKNEDKANELLKKAADAGNVKAKFLSIFKDIEDEDQKPDEETMKKIADMGAELKKLADAGDADAMALYALSLVATLDSAKPEEMGKIFEEVQEWGKKAQENGSIIASLDGDDDESEDEE